MDVLTDEKLIDVDVTVAIIHSRLCKLKLDKAAGDDRMTPRTLKALSYEVALPIAMICRKSLDTGSIPRDCRTVSPIF